MLDRTPTCVQEGVAEPPPSQGRCQERGGIAVAAVLPHVCCVAHTKSGSQGWTPRPAPHLLPLALLSRQLVQEAGLHHLRRTPAWGSRVLHILEARPPLRRALGPPRKKMASRGSGRQTPLGWGGGSVRRAGLGAKRRAGDRATTQTHWPARVCALPRRFRADGPALQALRPRGRQAANPLPLRPARRLGSDSPSSGGQDHYLWWHVLDSTPTRETHTRSRPPCPRLQAPCPWALRGWGWVRSVAVLLE